MSQALLLALALAPLSFGQTPDDETPVAVEPPTAPPMLQRVYCLGASASGGYGWNIELKTRAKIGLLLDQMLLGERAATVDLGSSMLFQAPERIGASQVESAIEGKASLVVGIDFLFWFAYTPRFERSAAPSRLERLEQGLALLERLECPVVVGDIPDMRLALTGEGFMGRPLLQSYMVPSEEDFPVLNARVREWAADREDTVVVPMHEFVRRAVEGEVLEVRGNRWDAKQVREILQADLLHPTVEGGFGLLTLALDELVLRCEALQDAHVDWDVEAARVRLLEATREGREKTLERERKREERRRAREERRKQDAEEEGDGRRAA